MSLPPGSAPGKPHMAMIGSVGIDFVSSQFQEATMPADAVQAIHDRCGLFNPQCKPFLALLSQLGRTHAQSHQRVLHQAKRRLTAAIPSLPKPVLENLLAVSFPYMGIPELRDIPVLVMENMDGVPGQFLKQLAEDKEVFINLPNRVQQQVWEYDKTLLQADAIPLVAAYKYETATILASLDMVSPATGVQEALEAAGREEAERRQEEKQRAAGPVTGEAARAIKVARTNAIYQKKAAAEAAAVGGAAAQRKPPRAQRRMIRRGSKAVQTLKNMVGTSAKIYGNVTELCVVKYRDSECLYTGLKETSYCTLRSQLLMALHDDDTGMVQRRDKCHSLAWTLDACINHGFVSTMHLGRLKDYFRPFMTRGAQDAGSSYTRGSGRLALDGSRKRARSEPMDVESAGSPVRSDQATEKDLAEAGMVLSDPPAMHVLVAAIVTQLQRIPKGHLPSGNADLLFLHRVLQLATSSRRMLQNRTYLFPVPRDEIMREFYPALNALLNEAEDVADPGAALGQPTPEMRQVAQYLPADAVTRKVVQMVILERLLRNDYVKAGRLLAVVRDTFKAKAVEEYAPFTASLARCLADGVDSGRVTPGGALWQLAVDGLLIKGVDGHVQAHEEVLRLLLRAAPQLGDAAVADYLRQTLKNSEASRTRKRKREKMYDHLPKMYVAGIGTDGEGEAGEAEMRSWSDSLANVTEAKLRVSTGLRAVYQMFLTKLPGFKAVAPPELLRYLAIS